MGQIPVLGSKDLGGVWVGGPLDGPLASAWGSEVRAFVLGHMLGDHGSYFGQEHAFQVSSIRYGAWQAPFAEHDHAQWIGL